MRPLSFWRNMKTPEWVELLLSQFGHNRFGGPMYRVMWSEDVFRWEYGKQVKTYGEGKDRWVLEKWLPPEMYDRVAWESEVLRDSDGLMIISPEGKFTYVMGPFPEQGAYEHCYTFEGLEGQYCPFEPQLVTLVCQCIERGKMMTAGERMAALKAKQEKEEKESERIFHDIWEDARPAPGAKLPDHCERILSFDVQRRLEEQTKHMPKGFSQVSRKDVEKLN